MSGFSLAARFPKASKSFLAAKTGLVAPKPSTVAVPTPQKSPLAAKFELMWEAIGSPAYVTELQVVEDRRFRFDYAWPDERVALELQGGIYLAGKGGHVAPKRFQNDCDKLNHAARAGWRTCKLATGMVTPENVQLVKDLVLAMRAAPEKWRWEQERLFALASITGKPRHAKAAERTFLGGEQP